MDNDTVFQIISIVLFGSLAVVGFSQRWKAARTGESFPRRREGVAIMILLRLAGLAVWGSWIAFMMNPAWMAWSSFWLPDYIRWTGVLIAAAAVVLLIWMFLHLGRNVTDTVSTRRDHVLVTHGPYRWVRHPMYSFSALLVLGIGLLTANGFIAVSGLLAILMLILRTPKEEARLIEAFGDDYRHYMQRTGRFIPRQPS